MNTIKGTHSLTTRLIRFMLEWFSAILPSLFQLYNAR